MQMNQRYEHPNDGNLVIDERNPDLAAELASNGRFYGLVDTGRGWTVPDFAASGSSAEKAIDALRAGFGRS